MDYQEIRAECDSAHQFIVKSLNGSSSQHRLHAGEIDQIIGVDNQRTEA